MVLCKRNIMQYWIFFISAMALFICCEMHLPSEHDNGQGSLIIKLSRQVGTISNSREIESDDLDASSSDMKNLPLSKIFNANNYCDDLVNISEALCPSESTKSLFTILSIPGPLIITSASEILTRSSQ